MWIFLKCPQQLQIQDLNSEFRLCRSHQNLRTQINVSMWPSLIFTDLSQCQWFRVKELKHRKDSAHCKKWAVLASSNARTPLAHRSGDPHWLNGLFIILHFTPAEMFFFSFETFSTDYWQMFLKVPPPGSLWSLAGPQRCSQWKRSSVVSFDLHSVSDAAPYATDAL